MLHLASDAKVGEVNIPFCENPTLRMILEFENQVIHVIVKVYCILCPCV